MMSAFDLMAAVSVGVLFSAGAYQMMSRSLQRVVFGFLLLSNAVNLSVIVAAGLPRRAIPPIVGDDPTSIYVDPLPHAFVLTAIVIGFAMAAFLVAMALRSDDSNALLPETSDGAKVQS